MCCLDSISLSYQTLDMSIKDILLMPPEDRLYIAEQIWKSLEQDHIQMTKGQKEELDHRISIDKAGEMQWFSLEDVKKKLDQD